MDTTLPMDLGGIIITQALTYGKHGDMHFPIAICPDKTPWGKVAMPWLCGDDIDAFRNRHWLGYFARDANDRSGYNCSYCSRWKVYRKANGFNHGSVESSAAGIGLWAELCYPLKDAVNIQAKISSMMRPDYYYQRYLGRNVALIAGAEPVQNPSPPKKEVILPAPQWALGKEPFSQRRKKNG